MMKFVYDDGGRAAAGFKGEAGDCVCRAIAIATERPYQEVYEELFAEIGWSPGSAGRKDADGLIRPRADNERKLARWYLEQRGWTWTPTMRVGQGCKVHLRAAELPAGRLIVLVSHHLVAVINGVIYDNHDCSRGGTRCVYGYFSLPSSTATTHNNREATTIARLAKQMLAVEKAPHDEELAQRHAAEWARVPWSARGLVIEEVKRLESKSQLPTAKESANG